MKCKAIVSEHGRLVIPAQIRKKLHISEGDQVVFILDKELKLVPFKNELDHIQDVVKRYNKKNISLVDELLKDRKEEAKNE